MFAIVFRHRSNYQLVYGVDILDCLNIVGAVNMVNLHGKKTNDPNEIIKQFNELMQSTHEKIIIPKQFCTVLLTQKIQEMIKTDQEYDFHISNDQIEQLVGLANYFINSSPPLDANNLYQELIEVNKIIEKTSGFASRWEENQKAHRRYCEICYLLSVPNLQVAHQRYGKENT